MSVAARRRGLRALRIVLAAMILAGLVFGVASDYGLRWDFANFYDTGHRVLAGQGREIYESTAPIAGEAPLGVMRFWGVPLAGVLYAPLALLPPEVALRVFKLENAVALLAALALLTVFHLKRVDPAPGVDADAKRTGLLVLAVVFQPFWTVFLVGGQTTPTVFLCLVGALILYTRGRVWGPAWLLTVALVLKPAFVLLVAPLVIAWQRRLIVALASCLFVMGLFSIALLGWTPHQMFLERMAIGLGDDRLWQFNSSVPSAILNFKLVWPSAVESLRLMAGVVRGATAVWLTVLIWRGSRSLHSEGQRHYVFLMAIVFFLLVSDILWEHYLMVLFIPATYVLARRERFSARAVWLMGLSLVLCLGQNVGLTLAVDRLVTIDTVAGVLAVGLWKSGPLVLLLTFLVCCHGDLVRSHDGLTLAPRSRRAEIDVASAPRVVR